jgi:hypothetical protein
MLHDSERLLRAQIPSAAFVLQISFQMIIVVILNALISFIMNAWFSGWSPCRRRINLIKLVVKLRQTLRKHVQFADNPLRAEGECLVIAKAVILSQG